MPKEQATPAKTIWDVSEQINFDEALKPDDPRFVQTGAARGEFSYNALFRCLGYDHEARMLKIQHQRRYAMFCGHRGCGKSTELGWIEVELNRPEAFFVISLDGVRELDNNNLQYADVLLALAQNLLKKLDAESIEIEEIFYRRLVDWFDERVEKHEATKEYALEVKAGAEGQTGIPFLGKLFASLTNSFKTNSTYKEELRRVLKNSFSEFADAFNQLIVASEEALAKANKGKKLLFLVDGTDRLNKEDSERFFIHDVNQLQLINGLFVYCAPISLIYQQNIVNENFDHVFKLPMIKLHEKDCTEPIQKAYETMRELVYRRADSSLFDREETLDLMVKHSGGHPRDLLRLLDYAFEFATSNVFDRRSAEKAVKALATDYRRILDAEDYRILREIDRSPAREGRGSERARYLLFNLVLLEYNEYWWQSHPVVRTLSGYMES